VDGSRPERLVKAQITETRFNYFFFMGGANSSGDQTLAGNLPGDALCQLLELGQSRTRFLVPHGISCEQPFFGHQKARGAVATYVPVGGAGNAASYPFDDWQGLRVIAPKSDLDLVAVENDAAIAHSVRSAQLHNTINDGRVQVGLVGRECAADVVQ
jgi:hypothetical protein